MEEDRFSRMTLRLPKTLYSQIENAADEAGRSVTAEIVGRLDQSFKGSVNDAEVIAALDRVQRNFADKERLLIQQSKSTRLFFDLFVHKFETAVAALEGSKKLSPSELRELTLDLHNAKEVRRMLEKNEGLEHIAEDDEDDPDDDDYQQDEPGLTVRNRP